MVRDCLITVQGLPNYFIFKNQLKTHSNEQKSILVSLPFFHTHSHVQLAQISLKNIIEKRFLLEKIVNRKYNHKNLNAILLRGRSHCNLTMEIIMNTISTRI